MTTQVRDAVRTRDGILQAAEKLIAEKGFQALTLDEVAVKASVSKGGLLHHYPSKQALLLGLAEKMISLHAKEIRDNLQQDPEGPGAFTRAFLRANLSCGEDDCTPVCDTLTAESRNIPAMLELFQQYTAQYQQLVENDGLDPVNATIVRYAAEGLMHSLSSGMPQPANYDAVVAKLLEMAGIRRQKA